MSYTIDGKTTGKIGFGLMSLHLPRAVPLTDNERIEITKTAVEAGCTLLDGAQFYGTPDNNSLTMLNKYFAKYPEDVEKVEVVMKGCYTASDGPVGSKDLTIKSIETCLSTLGPVGQIGAFGPARRDLNVDFENDTLATIDNYVKAGKIGAIALSELGPTTLRSAAQKFKIRYLEIEFSMYSPEPLHSGLLAACAEYGITVLAYTPLGKGLIAGKYKSFNDLEDSKKYYPRLSEENFDKNKQLAEKVATLSQKKGCTAAQVAINWILGISNREGMPNIIPIPGSTNAARIKENSTLVDLTTEDMSEIDKILGGFKTSGDRYPGRYNTELGR